MKKNKTMRIASVLLIAVLLTTSIISGTFAKYVTSGEVADSARVAKFGVVLAADGGLFANTYLATSNTPGNGEEDTTHDTSSSSLSVEADENVVAPGTKSADAGLKLSITGTPEVDVRIKFDFADLKDVFLKDGTYPDMTKAQYTEEFTTAGYSYYPIVYTVKGKLISEDNEDTLKLNNGGLTVDTDSNTMKGNLEAITKALKNLNGTDELGYFVDAGTNLGDEIGDLTITWAWAYEGPSTLNGHTFDATTVDQADTLLGDLAAVNEDWFATNQPEWAEEVIETLEALVKGTDYQTDVSLKITVTVTQID